MFPGVRPSIALASLPTASTVLSAWLDRDDRRLVQDDALAPHVDEGVRRAQVDGHVV